MEVAELPSSQTTPPSSSSPSHEFSFTISFHPSPPTKTSKSIRKTPSAIDLSPADDIFFHGHLLPLQLLSRPPQPSISPRPSIESQTSSLNHHNNNYNSKATKSSKPFFSLFVGRGKLRKENNENIVVQEKEKEKKKFDVGRLLKKYANVVETIFFPRGAKEKRDLRKRPYSFSGNSNWKGREEWIERKKKKNWCQFSAPASMRTSPTNSGHLIGPILTSAKSSSEESTMEELQSAIQAAIAHCKNSTNVVKDDNKCNSSSSTTTT